MATVNIVPRTGSEGQLGTESKPWALNIADSAKFKFIDTVTGQDLVFRNGGNEAFRISQGQNAVLFTQKLSGSVASTASFGRVQASAIGGNSPLIIDATNFRVDAAGGIAPSGNISSSISATGSFGHVHVGGAGGNSPGGGHGHIVVVQGGRGNQGDSKNSGITLHQGYNNSFTQTADLGTSNGLFSRIYNNNRLIIADHYNNAGGGIELRTFAGGSTEQTSIQIAGNTGRVTIYKGLVIDSTVTTMEVLGDISGSATTDIIVGGNIEAKGNITANQLIVSSSTTYMTTSFSSGNTAFGDDATDRHMFTGSLLIKPAAGATAINLVEGHMTASGHISSSISSTGSFGKVVATTLHGDGSNITGLNVDLANDSSPQLGADLDMNSSDISGSGNIILTGYVSASADFHLKNNKGLYIRKTGGTDVKVLTMDANNDVILAGPENETLKLNSNPNSAQAGIQFSVDGGTTTHMFLSQNGRFSIGNGTSTPAHPLDVTGNIRSTADVLAARFYSTTDASYVGVGFNNSPWASGSPDFNTVFNEHVDAVGIGTSDPTASLEVSGTFQATGRIAIPNWDATPAKIAGLNGWYVAHSYDHIKKVWFDSSGKGNNTIAYRGAPTFETIARGGEGANYIQHVIQGTGNDGLKFPTALLGNVGAGSNKWTIIHVARYNGSDKERIFQGATSDWYSGHQAGVAGRAFHGANISTT